MKRHEKAAARLVEQRLSLSPIEPLPTGWRPRDEPEGYRIQQAVNRMLTEAGLGPVVGHKIGCTTPVMQRFLGIPNPCAGDVFERTVMQRAGRVPRSGFIKLGIECEIAVRLGRDIFPQDAPFTRDSVAFAVDEVMAAIEIVDDRYRDYRALGVPTLIADDFFDSGCVLGEPVRDWRSLDLSRICGATRINGIEVGRGTGALVMDHPFEALAWLARARALRGMGLKKGAFVLLGSVVETKWLDAGDEVRVQIEELGEVSLSVGA
ncbi:MAG TPA: fumarylacetoacetate hydrolase family protein [Burkholderiales bacterium]|jgi:2-keto-4-pentenoate hydratase|nr:fumarylacetoacetate hydrolase family protein [Burkholderiales bacterium]